MKLATEEPRMIVSGQLNDLDKLLVARRPTENQPALLERFAKRRIEFITMPVPLADFFRTFIYFPSERTFSQQARPRAHTHCASELLHANQIAPFESDR